MIHFQHLIQKFNQFGCKGRQEIAVSLLDPYKPVQASIQSAFVYCNLFEIKVLSFHILHVAL